MTPCLDATGLRLAHRLEETSFRLAGGELACLIGPNGAGKTSLLHAIAGIGGPTGEVRIDGVDPKPLPPRQRQRLFAYLPASRHIVWPLTARDLVTLGLPQQAGDNAIDDVFKILELEGMADRRIDHLSTGERSRVLVARALVANSRVLLLDEPTANLDPLWQLRLMDHLREFTRATGQAILVAVHDLELARHYADRLIVMDKGRIQADGDPQMLLAGPEIQRIFGIQNVDGHWRPLA